MKNTYDTHFLSTVRDVCFKIYAIFYRGSVDVCCCASSLVGPLMLPRADLSRDRSPMQLDINLRVCED